MHFEDERSVYPPLIPVFDRRAEKVLERADESVVQRAFAALRHIDNRTISVAAFEEVLVAAYYHDENSEKA
jgi:hypothetical protein